MQKQVIWVQSGWDRVFTLLRDTVPSQSFWNCYFNMMLLMKGMCDIFFWTLTFFTDGHFPLALPFGALSSMWNLDKNSSKTTYTKQTASSMLRSPHSKTVVYVSAVFFNNYQRDCTLSRKPLSFILSIVSVSVLRFPLSLHYWNRNLLCDVSLHSGYHRCVIVAKGIKL